MGSHYQDSHNIQVGTPVFAPETGNITRFVQNQPHDPRPVKRLNSSVPRANAATNPSHVTGGQQIGTIDISGCTSAPHTHIQRKRNGVLVNFTIPCDNSHFDDPSTYYDDSDGTF
jgi:hypothetical protein